jgi:hypothetical protein
MAIYTIDNNNLITMHSGAPDLSAGARFESAKDLAKAAAEWPVSRLAEVWNKLPIDGLKPVKKFMDRKTALARIWDAVQKLTPAPEAANSARKSRQDSKKASVLAMLRNPEGATLAQIMEATGWQRHTVRGFISGAVGKQLGLTVESTRTEQGERRYRLPA